MIRRPSIVVRPSSIFKDLLLQNRLAYQSQISYGASVCSRGLGHMTKMAATPIYGKNP